MKSPVALVVKLLDSDIIAISNLSLAITFTFRLIPLGKVVNSLKPQAIGGIVPLLFFYTDGSGIKFHKQRN